MNKWWNMVMPPERHSKRGYLRDAGPGAAGRVPAAARQVLVLGRPAAPGQARAAARQGARRRIRTR